MISEDREILHQIWNGRIPTCISLSSDDLVTLTKPDPIYVLLPRLSYMFLIREKIKSSFQKFMPPALEEGDVWFECNGTPLKPQYPIGVLHDLLNTEESTPWNITLHFSKLPKSIINIPNISKMESQFLFSIKEADSLKHRGTVINNISSKELGQLWTGLLNDKFEQFWNINHKLMDSSSTNGFRSIPFRLHLPLADSSEEEGAYAPAIMLLQPVANSTGQLLTLGDMVNDTLVKVLQEGDSLMTQGITPPLETPLLWLSQHLSYADNFLHFCVRRNCS